MLPLDSCSQIENHGPVRRKLWTPDKCLEDISRYAVLQGIKIFDICFSQFYDRFFALMFSDTELFPEQYLHLN